MLTVYTHIYWFQKHKNIRQQFLDVLPKTFDRNQYLETAEKLSINAKTAEGYIKKFVEANLLDHHKHNHYINLKKVDEVETKT